MKREQTRAFQVGNLTLGGNNHVIIQSMTNTKTKFAPLCPYVQQCDRTFFIACQ